MTRFLTFHAGGRKFALPHDSVEQILESKDLVRPVPLVPTFVQGIVNFRGRIVTIIDLMALLGVDRDSESADFLCISSKSPGVGYAVQGVRQVLAAHEGDVEDAARFGLEGRVARYVNHVVLDAGGTSACIVDTALIERELKNPDTWSGL